MGTRNGPYQEDFPTGTVVRIRGETALNAFRDAWRWHHSLVAEQLRFAGQTAIVKSVAFYHGSDELYELDGIPGVWHEQCLEPSKRRDSDLRRWYSGYLIVKDMSDDVRRQMADLAHEIPIFDVYSHAVEVEYQGRDTSRFVLRALLRLAKTIGDADGSIQCQISGDVDQIWLEFYRIRDGRLFRQHGEIVRQPEHEVTES